MINGWFVFVSLIIMLFIKIEHYPCHSDDRNRDEAVFYSSTVF